MSKHKDGGIIVKVLEPSNPDSLDKALKRLKKKVKKSNILIELYEAMHYKKPSEKKREKRRKAIARSYYKLLEERRNEGNI
jgi:ribosomal protein S21